MIFSHKKDINKNEMRGKYIMKNFVKEILGETGEREVEVRMMISEIVEELLPIKVRMEINKLIEDGTIPTLEDFTKARQEQSVVSNKPQINVDRLFGNESISEEEELLTANVENNEPKQLVNDQGLIDTIKLVVQDVLSEKHNSETPVMEEYNIVQNPMMTRSEIVSTEYDIDEYGIQVYTALKNRLEQKSKHLSEEYDRLDREVCYMIVRQTVPKEEIIPLQNKLEIIKEEKRKVDELLGVIE